MTVQWVSVMIDTQLENILLKGDVQVDEGDISNDESSVDDVNSVLNMERVSHHGQERRTEKQNTKTGYVRHRAEWQHCPSA